MRQSYNFNCPAIPLEMDTAGISPWFNIESQSIILDTLKVSEYDGEGTDSNKRLLVARFYESCGICQQAKYVFVRKHLL